MDDPAYNIANVAYIADTADYAIMPAAAAAKQTRFQHNGNLLENVIVMIHGSWLGSCRDREQWL